MTEHEWLTAETPAPMLAFLRDKVSDRKVRLFAVACCHRIWHLLPDAWCQAAVTAAERLADLPEVASAVFALSDQIRPSLGSFALRGETSEYAALAAMRVASREEAHLTEEAAAVARAALQQTPYQFTSARYSEGVAHATLLRDIFENPFRPVRVDPAWRTDTAVTLARQMYESREFGAMPILADALQDAGCDSDDILNHCRDASAAHVRGCWVCDMVLGKE